jgi:hypothetical protein
MLYHCNLKYKRVCPQTIFQVLCLKRQGCQIKEDNRVAKNMGQEKGSEKERDENKNQKGGGGSGRTRQITGSPSSSQFNSFKSCLNPSLIFTANLHHISFCG